MKEKKRIYSVMSKKICNFVIKINQAGPEKPAKANI